MNDFEMMCAMYDRAGIGYTLDDMEDFYLDDGKTSRSIKIEAKQGAGGYGGFVCYHTFDANGSLLNAYVWE